MHHVDPMLIGEVEDQVVRELRDGRDDSRGFAPLLVHEDGGSREEFLLLPLPELGRELNCLAALETRKE